MSSIGSCKPKRPRASPKGRGTDVIWGDVETASLIEHVLGEKSADEDGDGKVSLAAVMFFESAEHFVGFQPLMEDHFQGFDVAGDG